MIPVWWSITLTVLGGLGWLLVTVDRRIHGFCVGLLAQVAWVAYAVATAQWGFLGSATLFGAINALGLYRWRQSRKRSAATTARDERLWHEANPGCTCRWSPLTGHDRLCPAWTPPARLVGLFSSRNPATDPRRGLPPTWGAAELPPGPNRYQYVHQLPDPVPSSRRKIERIVRAGFVAHLAEKGWHRLPEGALMAFWTTPRDGGGVAVMAHACVESVTNHRDTAAMQRADGERLIPPVPSTHREDPSQ